MTLERVKKELKEYNGKPVKIMEVCGTHTAGIFKHGIRSLLSPQIQLISGPGCPVCVTPSAYIDKLVEYSLRENHCVLTFGDMMKVKGTQMSLTEAKARGGCVRIFYSPLSAIKMAMDEPKVQFIVAAVGFETTIPIYAILLQEILSNSIKNIKMLNSLKTIIPALSYISEHEKEIDAFLCPGHVSVITGSKAYQELAEKYQKPFVIGGFEGEHLIAAIHEILHQLQSKNYGVKNMYPSAVSEEGNQKAQLAINQFYEKTDAQWRGIGVMQASGLKLKDEYKAFDAGSELTQTEEKLPFGCKCTEVILGRIQPIACPLFHKVCTPMNAIGPCMVSAEGACGIWYKNHTIPRTKA